MFHAHAEHPVSQKSASFSNRIAGFHSRHKRRYDSHKARNQQRPNPVNLLPQLPHHRPLSPPLLLHREHKPTHDRERQGNPSVNIPPSSPPNGINQDPTK